MIHRVRVIYGDTDMMGVVYYANYLRYFESARAAFLRALGKSNADLDAWGVFLPVVEAQCRYRSPAHYEDLLDIRVSITQLRGASMRFAYQVTRDGTILADGFTLHAVMNKSTGRPRAMPKELRALIEQAANEPADRLAI